MVFRFKRDAEEIAKRIKDHEEELRHQRQTEKLLRRQRQREKLRRAKARKNAEEEEDKDEDEEEEEEEEDDEDEDKEVDAFALCFPDDISDDSSDLLHWPIGFLLQFMMNLMFVFFTKKLSTDSTSSEDGHQPYEVDFPRSVAKLDSNLSLPDGKQLIS